jgi:hypothetical protein
MLSVIEVAFLCGIKMQGDGKEFPSGNYSMGPGNVAG